MATAGTKFVAPDTHQTTVLISGVRFLKIPKAFRGPGIYIYILTISNGLVAVFFVELLAQYLS